MAENKKSNTMLWVAIVTGIFTLCGTIITVIVAPIVIERLESNNPTEESTLARPTDLDSTGTPILAATWTLTPLAITKSTAPTTTPTETATVTNSPTPNPFSGYIGTWILLDKSTSPVSVSYALERLIIKPADGNLVSFETCRCDPDTNACGEAISVFSQDSNKPVTANLEDNLLVANEAFILNKNDTDITQSWKIEVIKSGSNLLVRIKEHKDGIDLEPEIFELKKLSFSMILTNCAAPVLVGP